MLFTNRFVGANIKSLVKGAGRPNTSEVTRTFNSNSPILKPSLILPWFRPLLKGFVVQLKHKHTIGDLTCVVLFPSQKNVREHLTA